MKSRETGGPVSRLYTKKIAKSGAIWRYEKCVENVHPIKLRCKTPKPRFSKIKLFNNGREDRLNSSSPHPKILPVNQPSFPNTAAKLLIPYAFLVKRLLTVVAANPPMLVPS
jgi:hypothetical protein